VKIRGILRILTTITVLLLAQCFWASAQGFTGFIKNEKGCISITSSEFENPEALAAAHKVSVQDLLEINPGLQAGNFAGLTNLWIPVSSLLKGSACEGCSPVYHKVNQGEGLFRIGRWYGNIPVNTLKERNNLRGDNLKPGQQILVGYVEASAAAPVQHTVKDTAKRAEEPALQVNTQTTVASPNTGEVIAKPPVTPQLEYTGTGLFKDEFENGPKSGGKKAGKAASFKSESGWKDGRFYLLCNYLKPGSVVKLVAHRSGKIIFAKVVGPLPQIKQNDGLQWRLSTAAAASLGIWDENEVFDLEMEY
jgi:LysM repeat protein